MTSTEDSLDSLLFGPPSSPPPLPSFATSLESFHYPAITFTPSPHADPHSLYPAHSAPSPSSPTSPVHSPQLSPATLESFVVSHPPSDATLHLPILTISPVPSPNPSPPQQPTLVPSPVPATPVSPLPTSPYASAASSDSSSPSPPTVFTPYVPPSSSPTNKKRKQDGPDIKDFGSPGAEWKEYLLAPHYYQVHDALTLQPITEFLDVTAQQMGSKFTFSQSENLCICYRQNQFKVFCLFRSPQPVASMCVNDGGIPKKITQICAKLYAINEINGALRDELRVGLHIAGKKRRKEAKVEVDITPFEKGKIEFSNLQFEKSNAAKQPSEQQEFFHIVLAVFAKCEDSSTYHILSKISPRIIVRAQNPGFYDETKPPPTPLCTDTTMFSTNFVANSSVNNDNNTTASADVNNVNYQNPAFHPQPTYLIENNSYEDNVMSNHELTVMEVDAALGGRARVKKEEESWQCAEDVVSHYGKVGINTSDPKEALHVQGNVLVTGTVYKPSDMRIKSQIEKVDPKLQLSNIRQLQIYDYVVQSRQERERGVLAQELAKVMPDAVHEMGDVEMGSTTVPNLLVVNERVLLYENIGATQQLDKELEEKKEVIEKIDDMVSDLAKTTNQSTEDVQNVLKSMLDLMFKEECRNKVSYAGLQEEYVNFSFNLFRMGPARTLFVLGNFTPWAWVLGACYIFSNIKERKWLGLSSLLRYVTFITLQVLFFYEIVGFNSVWINMLSGMGGGLWTLLISYVRLRKTLQKESTDDRSHLFKALGFKPPEQQYKYLFF